MFSFFLEIWIETWTEISFFKMNKQIQTLKVRTDYRCSEPHSKQYFIFPVFSY